MTFRKLISLKESSFFKNKERRQKRRSIADYILTHSVILPNEAVISDGDRIDFEFTVSTGSGRALSAGVGATVGAGWQAAVAAGAHAGAAAAQGLAGAAHGAAGAHFGAQELQVGAHFGAQGSHFGAQGSQEVQANRSANRPPKGRNSQHALRGSQLATGAHFGAQGLQELQAGAPHPHFGAAGEHFGAQGLQELQAGAPQPQELFRQLAAVKTLKKLIRFFPGYQSSTIPQLTSQRAIGAQGLQDGAQVAGAQVAGAHVAGAAGAASAGAASASAGVGAAAGAQEDGAQAAFAPQKAQFSFPQRFPTVQGSQGLQDLHAGAPQPQAGAAGAHFGAHGSQTGPHFGAQGLQELHAGAPQPHFGAHGSQQSEPNRQFKMPRFFPGYQSLLQAGFSYVQRGWYNGARHGLTQGLQPILLQQQAFAGLPQFEQAGC